MWYKMFGVVCDVKCSGMCSSVEQVVVGCDVNLVSGHMKDVAMLCEI